LGQQTVNSHRRQQKRHHGKYSYQLRGEAARSERTVNNLIHRTEIENRQIGIDCLNLTTYLRLQTGGGQRSPDRHALGQGSGSWKLVDRSVDVGNSGLVEAITVDVLDHANHDAPRR